MGIFKKNPQTFVGVDIGSVSIKMVELERADKGQLRLRTFALVEDSRNLIKDRSNDAVDAVAQAIAEGKKRAGIIGRRVVSAIPNIASFQSVIALASKKDLAKRVLEEAGKFIPLPIEEVSIDWRVVDNFGTYDKEERSQSAKVIRRKDEYTHAYISATPKSLVVRYVNAFAKAGMELAALETQGTSLVRSLVGNDKSSVIIIDIGHRTADVMLVTNGIVTITRSVVVGGGKITDVIAEKMHIDTSAAEQFKKDLGTFDRDSGKQEKIPPFIADALSPLMDEVRFVVNEGPSKQLGSPEKIIITGGSAFLPSLDRVLQQTFSLPTVIGDPWARVAYPPDLEMTLAKLAPRFSIAIGCARRV